MAGASVLSGGSAFADEPPGWPTAPAAEMGFSADPGRLIDEAFAKGDLAGLHGVVVTRNGKLVAERYFTGTDEIWGQSRGAVTFTAAEPHDLRSVSKSIVGLLYGIALERGLVPAPQTPLLDAFPAYTDLTSDPVRQALTVGHALTMTLGTAWNESLPYSDPRNSEIAMENAPDRYRYVLDRPIEVPPGTRWTYNGGATALLGYLIEIGSGATLLDFAGTNLFGPLGIRDASWTKGFDGRYSAASGLRLRPRDLARIGQLVLDRGSLGERQLIPATWLNESFQPRTQTPDGLGYGYQWWLGRLRDGQPWMAAFGNGGQRLLLVPSLGIAIAITAGNYNKSDAWQLPVAVVEIVLGSLP